MSEWRQEGEALVRDMKFDDFAGAMAWNNVRLIPTTPSAGAGPRTTTRWPAASAPCDTGTMCGVA